MTTVWRHMDADGDNQITRKEILENLTEADAEKVASAINTPNIKQFGKKVTDEL